MKLELELNRREVGRILRSEEVRADLAARAARIAAAAGPGHASSSIIGRTRALAMVWTDTPEAMVGEARRQTLTRAVDAARG